MIILYTHTHIWERTILGKYIWSQCWWDFYNFKTVMVIFMNFFLYFFYRIVECLFICATPRCQPPSCTLSDALSTIIFNSISWVQLVQRQSPPHSFHSFPLPPFPSPPLIAAAVAAEGSPPHLSLLFLSMHFFLYSWSLHLFRKLLIQPFLSGQFF